MLTIGSVVVILRTVSARRAPIPYGVKVRLARSIWTRLDRQTPPLVEITSRTAINHGMVPQSFSRDRVESLFPCRVRHIPREGDFVRRRIVAELSFADASQFVVLGDDSVLSIPAFVARPKLGDYFSEAGLIFDNSECFASCIVGFSDGREVRQTNEMRNSSGSKIVVVWFFDGCEAKRIGSSAAHREEWELWCQMKRIRRQQLEFDSSRRVISVSEQPVEEGISTKER